MILYLYHRLYSYEYTFVFHMIPPKYKQNMISLKHRRHRMSYCTPHSVNWKTIPTFGNRSKPRQYFAITNENFYNYQTYRFGYKKKTKKAKKNQK